MEAVRASQELGVRKPGEKIMPPPAFFLSLILRSLSFFSLSPINPCTTQKATETKQICLLE